jgi:hypothetical protein
VRRFAGELSNAMARRGIGPTALGRMIGASPTMVHNWKRGVSTPIHRTVLVLSEALDWEQLIAVSIEERTRECEICGASIFDESKERGRRRYCGTRCQRVAYDRRKEHAKAEATTLLRNRLRAHQKAVAAYCSGCAPDGVCPLRRECDLFEVSPYSSGSELPTPLYDSPTVKVRRAS